MNDFTLTLSLLSTLFASRTFEKDLLLSPEEISDFCLILVYGSSRAYYWFYLEGREEEIGVANGAVCQLCQLPNFVNSQEGGRENWTTWLIRFIFMFVVVYCWERCRCERTVQMVEREGKIGLSKCTNGWEGGREEKSWTTWLCQWLGGREEKFNQSMPPFSNGR